MAAWADRGLPADAAAKVELHLSNCERCQEVLAAFMRSEPALRWGARRDGLNRQACDGVSPDVYSLLARCRVHCSVRTCRSGCAGISSIASTSGNVFISKDGRAAARIVRQFRVATIGPA